MINLKGCQLDKFPLDLQFIVHLEYYEGPLFSLFQNTNGDFYCYSWCDSDNLCNRWLVFRVKRDVLKQYLEGTLNLRYLIMNPVDGFLYVLDILDSLEVDKALLTQPKNLPDSYKPTLDSYYSFEDLSYEAAAQVRKLISQLFSRDVHVNETQSLLNLRSSDELTRMSRQKSLKLKRIRDEYEHITYYRNHPSELNTYLIQIGLRITFAVASINIFSIFLDVSLHFLERSNVNLLPWPIGISIFEIINWTFRILTPSVITTICLPAITTWNRVRDFENYQKSIDKRLQ